MTGPVHFDLDAMKASDAALRADLAAKMRAEARSDQDRAVTELVIALQKANSEIVLAVTAATNAGVPAELIALNLGNGVAAIEGGAIRNTARYGGETAVTRFLLAEQAMLEQVLSGQDFGGTVATHKAMAGGHA